MEITKIDKPYISEDYIKEVVDLKIFMNILYSNPDVINRLLLLIDERFSPFNREYVMSDNRKIITMKLKKTNIKNLYQFKGDLNIQSYYMIIGDLLVNFFSLPEIQQIIQDTINNTQQNISLINNLCDPEFIKTTFTISIIADNIIYLYL